MDAGGELVPIEVFNLSVAGPTLLGSESRDFESLYLDLTAGHRSPATMHEVAAGVLLHSRVGDWRGSRSGHWRQKQRRRCESALMGTPRQGSVFERGIALGRQRPCDSPQRKSCRARQPGIVIGLPGYPGVTSALSQRRHSRDLGLSATTGALACGPTSVSVRGSRSATLS